ncbi:hypothetical protein GYMLUDRAFT_40497 [Collybiopsis luxurians FD-317 M1]|uniref:SigF-like NTF2-like domain-containing protein n=1 Tax=Collybiopsis luxurians FD-317 M1 TaxID=944289 RepID=A0A0D0D4B3_9AGAR|nr:hypothetical protein GYMLUDRAFT_40497 [Collybiopsis luxurians FD-317 M1]
MQDPEHEITSVVLQLTTAESPDIQKAAFEKYVSPDVGFKHPLCYVPPSRNSRETLLGIYQWYRVLSPRIIGKMNNVVYDKENHILLLDMSQIFHIRLSPFKPAWSRLLVRVTLREVDGLFYISYQEDFYHTEEFANLLIPFLTPAILLVKISGTAASNFYASIAQTLGFWRPTNKRSQNPERGLYDGDKTD